MYQQGSFFVYFNKKYSHTENCMLKYHYMSLRKGEVLI